MSKPPTQRNKGGILQQFKEMYGELMDFMSPSDMSLYDNHDTQGTVPDKIPMGGYRRKFAQVTSIQCIFLHFI